MDGSPISPSSRTRRRWDLHLWENKKTSREAAVAVLQVHLYPADPGWMNGWMDVFVNGVRRTIAENSPECSGSFYWPGRVPSLTFNKESWRLSSLMSNS